MEWWIIFSIWLMGFLVLEAIFHLADRRVWGRWRFDDEGTLFLVCAFWFLTIWGLNREQLGRDLTAKRR